MSILASDIVGFTCSLCSLSAITKVKGKRLSRTWAKEVHTDAIYPGFCSMKQLRILLLPPDGMLVHRRVTPSSMSPVLIYTPGWRETLWGKVSCLRKQHNGRDWVSTHRASELKVQRANYYTTAPPSKSGKTWKMARRNSSYRIKRCIWHRDTTLVFIRG